MKRLVDLIQNEELLSLLSEEQMNEVKGGNVIIVLEP